MKYFSEPFKQDDSGLFFLDDKDIKLELFHFNEILPAYSYHRNFYYIDGIDNYVIKDIGKHTLFNNTKIKKMLLNLRNRQDRLTDIDFPIGYYVKDNRISGTIVPYYKDSVSISQLVNLYSFSDLEKFYMHDEDDFKNLICLCLDIINIIEKMYKESIIYTDINPGNFLVYNNSVKIIDFESNYVRFTNKRNEYFKSMLSNYNILVNYILNHYKFRNEYYHPGEDFDDAKDRVKSLYKGLKK